MFNLKKITLILLVLGSFTSIPKAFSDNNGKKDTDTYSLYCPDKSWKHPWKEIDGHFHSCDGGMPSGSKTDRKTCNSECFQTNKNPYD